VEEFFARLKEHKLVQWTLGYMAVSFALIPVLDIIASRFGWPQTAVRCIIIALATGFFMMLVVAWYHGERGAERITRTEHAWLALLLVLGVLAMWRIGPAKEAPAAEAHEGTSTSAVAIKQKSIAVLAFTDLSPAHDQAYFSDGMSEEILNALAQVKDLKVAGRTSSFYFKGRDADLRAIGRTLGVANILEGSVRKQGGKVRITAQLIQVADDTQLWSHAYDGDLSDVFQLQENIARAITDQLKVVLVGDQKTRLVPVATSNTEAYTLYLRATEALNKRDYARMGDAIGWLQQAIKLDPNFAAAHARLAMIHVLGWSRYGASLGEGERQAQLAFALDPKIAETQYALSLLARDQRRFLDARKAMDRALELAPDDASANLYDAQLLIMTGYTRQGIERLDRALAIDPLLPNALHWRAAQYLFAGDTDTAARLWKRAGDLGLSYANFGLAEVAKARGNYAKARSLGLPQMLANPGNNSCLKTPDVSLPIYLEGALGGDAAAGVKALAVVDECLAAKPEPVPIWAVLGLLHFGQNERALQVIAQGPTSDDAGLFISFWSPRGRAALRLPEFAAFARKMGFAELWDRDGAPDGCRRKTPGDYVCE
jgi:TolB-like protein